MKNICLFLTVFIFNSLSSQFFVKVEVSPDFASRDAILYTLDGSKDIISSKEIRKGNTWLFKVSKPYTGMLKMYFPETNYSFNLISENKDVSIKLQTSSKSVEDVTYLDQSNILMDKVQDLQNKNQLIFPALVQIKEYYSPNTPFGAALTQEIDRLGKKLEIDATKNPFIYYYNTNYNKFLVENSAVTAPSQSEIVSFITKSNEMLETSSLLRPILVNYLNTANNSNADQAVDLLLNELIVETPRGQTVLSEFIDIFGVYNMTALKDKYLTQAKNLKCTINSRLATTLQSNKNVEIGAVFPNNTFSSSVNNSTVKSLHDVKASKKIIMFWSSACSHCEKDLPIILEKYKLLKSQNIEVIGFSLDTDKTAYQKKVNALPWVNDTELKGWNSSYGQTYNVSATPTYYVLDSANKVIATPNSISDVFAFLSVK